jgi:hypothetical protein
MTHLRQNQRNRAIDVDTHQDWEYEGQMYEGYGIATIKALTGFWL